MIEPTPAGGTGLLERPALSTASGPGEHSHVVPPKDGANGPTRVSEARVTGTPITALCGYTWVPSRDPINYPPCSECIRLFEAEAGDDGTLS